MVVENVKGAQPWVGRARWNYGSFYLWGDVPALMPITFKGSKVPGFRFDGSGGSFQTAAVEGTKVTTMGAGWYPPDHPKHVKGLGFNTASTRLRTAAALGSTSRTTPRAGRGGIRMVPCAHPERGLVTTRPASSKVATGLVRIARLRFLGVPAANPKHARWPARSSRRFRCRSAGISPRPSGRSNYWRLPNEYVNAERIGNDLR